MKRPYGIYFRKLALIVSLAAVFLEIGLRIEGKAVFYLQEYRNRQTLKQRGDYRILCLGEATTQNQYPPILEEILNQHDIGVRFAVIDKGNAAATSAGILNSVEAYLDIYRPDLVIVMMGINDSGADVLNAKADLPGIIRFFTSMRTYKIARSLWPHVDRKLKAIGSFRTRDDGRKRDKGKGLPAAPDSPQELCVLSQPAVPCTQAIEPVPHDDNAYIARAFEHQRRGDFTQAEISFRKALETNPRNDGAYSCLVF